MHLETSYRVDALSLVIEPHSDLIKELSLMGYTVRQPLNTDILKTAKGYNKSNAKVLEINEHAYTLQTREEFTKPNKEGKIYRLADSGFLALTGSDLDGFPIKEFLEKTKDISHATRFDVACDLIFNDYSDLYNLQEKISGLVGFSGEYHNGNLQNKDNAITSGRKNKKSPISIASKSVSNGLTLYIGSRQSRFMMRVYDKSAEIKKKYDNEIPPTLRFEQEVKSTVADAIRKFIIKSGDDMFQISKKIWHNVSDDFITFNDVSLVNVLGLKNSKEIGLDYSKIEGEKMGYENWVQKSVAPKFSKIFSDLTLDDKIQKALKLMLSEEDYEKWESER